jgi:hypothetical protein
MIYVCQVRSHVDDEMDKLQSTIYNLIIQWHGVLLIYCVNFYITIAFYCDICGLTDIVYYIVTISTSFGCTCKWIYGNKYIHTMNKHINK